MSKVTNRVSTSSARSTYSRASLKSSRSYVGSRSYIPDDSEYPSARPSIMQDIIRSIFEPGINRGVMVMMHVAFISLISSLLWMIFLTESKNPHVWFLLIISILLYGTITWFVSELTIAMEEQREAIEQEKRELAQAAAGSPSQLSDKSDYQNALADVELHECEDEEDDEDDEDDKDGDDH